MLSSERLANLEQVLNLRYETLTEAQNRLAISDNIFERTAIKQRIRQEILPDIRQFEAEYWELLAQQARSTTVAEADASNAIIEVESQVVQLMSNTSYPDQLMRLLEEIRNQLNQPENPAAAKAKLALNLIPGILSYEVELNTTTALKNVFQPIRNLFREK
ncbi:hypothetical protein [Nostoc sp. 106C]|uniref:hypothetical protein n=1 Tax=Nostoc sp. 106C TaxID=1932667 RepID=UPI000A379475|nr:hypothetical protein [Nostoc sp. 106C]OUL18192.1 hypothetical protein BV375_34000 [Nostoc sp. 106C]